MTSVRHGELIELLSQTPSLVAACAFGVSAPDLTWRPAGAEFSLVAHACHMRDLEVEGYSVRLRRLLDLERPRLEGFDGARVAAERNYDVQNLDEAVAAFRDARLANLRAVASLTEEQLARTGIFQDTSDVTLLDVLEMMREHDEDHLRQLRELGDALRARRSTSQPSDA